MINLNGIICVIPFFLVPLQVEKKKHMDNKIIFFESTIANSKNDRKENSNQKGKEEKKMQYTERYYG